MNAQLSPEEFAKQGILAVVAASLAVFIYRSLFPLVRDQLAWARTQIEQARQENRDDMRRMLEALERQQGEFEKIVAALDRVNDNIERLADKIDHLGERT